MISDGLQKNCDDSGSKVHPKSQIFNVRTRRADVSKEKSFLHNVFHSVCVTFIADKLIQHPFLSLQKILLKQCNIPQKSKLYNRVKFNILGQSAAAVMLALFTLLLGRSNYNRPPQGRVKMLHFIISTQQRLQAFLKKIRSYLNLRDKMNLC